MATKALRMVILNWSWLLFAVVAASGELKPKQFKTVIASYVKIFDREVHVKHFLWNLAMSLNC